MPPAPEIDLVVVGSLNADITARVHRFPSPGETLPATALTVRAGGKGANQAAAAARLGARTAMVGRVGDDEHADMLLGALRTEGVDTAHTVRDERVTTGTALITVAESGENSIVISAAANTHLSDQDIADALPLISRAPAVCMSLEIPVGPVVATARAVQRAGGRVVLNLSPVVELPRDVLAVADPLIVNEHEARQLLDRAGPRPTGASVTDDAEALCQFGVRSAVVTLGGSGVAVADPRASQHIPGLPVDAIDTTGAGDAFAATVGWRLGHGDDLVTAARWATRVSACSVQRPGTHESYPTLDTVHAWEDR